MKENAIWLTFPSVSSDFFLGARYKVVTINDNYYFLSSSIKRKIYVFLFNLKNKFDNNLLEKAYNDALLCTFEKQKDKVEKIINELNWNLIPVYILLKEI